MTTITSPRTVAARVILRWFVSGDFPDRLIPDKTDQRSLVQEIVYGSVRWKRFLESIISTLSSREPDPETKAYLIIGLYQLFLMDNIPVHAAINGTVEAAKADLDHARIRFVNGVLRSSQRQHDAILQGISKSDIGVRLSHPDILIERWFNHYGQTETDALCKWNNQRPTVAIRLRSNADKQDTDALRALLQPHPAAPESFLLVPSGITVTDLPGFNKGAFYVQDPATSMAVSLLNLSPGLKLLDACAAPGGKTFACADAMQDEGLIMAADLHQDRLEKLHQNANRIGFSCINVTKADATSSVVEDDVHKTAPFDRILLDVPCSNTGVLNRRPDARWRFSEERLASLVDVQRRMLDSMSQLLVPGGVLVYSTCSLEPEENENQIHSWLEHHPDFTETRQYMNLPPASGTDGAFAAQLTRKPV